MSTETNIAIKTDVDGATKNLFTGKPPVIPAPNFQPPQVTVTVKTDNT